MLNKHSKIASLGLLSLLTVACATTKVPSEKLAALETQYQGLVQQGEVAKYAPVALKEADEAIDKVQRLEKERAEKEVIAHHQYLAQMKLDTAVQIAKQKRAEAYIADADVNRKDVLLTAKSQEAEAAKANAEEMRLRAESAEEEVERAKASAREMAEKANALTKTLQDISAKESERGLVLTMGNILFELNKSSLKSGAERTLSRVAEFLQQYPARQVLVEGFTDSLGSDAYNQNLSERRAEAVVSFLVSQGVAQSRLTSKGYGEEYPVGNNETDSGRQQNRRVELIISNVDQQPVKQR
jgi:outer membrane protein OmpA-like peptidoglycan-associated protein